MTDVVVVGAGAAGISAAKVLQARGLDVVVIEAASRIGGRVHTDHAIFGVPYDMGAHWLHYREKNPFAEYGLANGFDIYPAPEDSILYVGDRPATGKEAKAYAKACSKAEKAMTKAAKKGRDVSPASVIPDLGEWTTTAHMMVGPYEIARDTDDFSCTDWHSAEDGTDFYCREGFGVLVAHFARNVPVRLNTAATRISWGDKGVTVDTQSGTISARAVVVTVSVGVLASEAITFDPPLPARKQEALGQLTMGHYNHVVLQFDENFFGVGEDGYYRYKIERQVDGAPQGFAALVDAAGSGLTYCDLGGRFARDLAKEGPEASVDFVLEELKRSFGSKLTSALVKSHTYDWSHDPLVMGAYSAARPGGDWTRKEMRKPLAERVWFAGEALSKSDWATVAGASKSGTKTAKRLARALAR